MKTETEAMKNCSVILVITMCFLWRPVQAQVGCTLPDNLFIKDTVIICSDTAYRLALPNYAGSSFVWSNGSSDTSIFIAQSGRYSVQVSDTKCTRNDSVYIILNSLIQSPIPDSVIICIHKPAQPLRAIGDSLLWYANAIGGTGSPTPIVPSSDSLGLHYYYVSQTILGCESPRAKAQVETIDKPHFNLGKNILVPCNLDGIVLQVIPENYTTYTWWDGTTGATYQARQPGLYILRADNQCGSLTDSVITVDCKAKCLQIPNAFTPNGDGLNDYFRATAFCPIQKFKLVIYDRYGEMVFLGTNPQMAWDGKLAGKKLQTGIYTYYCQYDDFVLKQDVMVKGTITLIQ